MSRALAIAGVALFGLAFTATRTTAQQQTVFIHGLASSGDTWEEAAQRLSNVLAIDPKRPSTDWRASYDDQANMLNADDSLRGSALAIGHSNGGVVARRWARERPLDGIVTVGTPNRGAPLVSNLGLYASYTWSGIRTMVGAGEGIAYLANTRSLAFGACCDWWWLAQQVLSSLSVTTGLMNYGFYGMLGGLGLNVFAPVLGQMEPTSGFMADLNRPDNIAWEMSAVPTRIGIASSAPFWGGPFRAFTPAADEIGWVVKGGAWTLYFVAARIMAETEPDDWQAWEAAYQLLAAGSYLDSLDGAWCAAVSSVGMQYCDYNDSVVPIWSQLFPGAVNIYTGDEAGPVHTQETKKAGPWLYEALAHYAHVPLRADPPVAVSRLNTGQGLAAGQSIASPSGQVVLTYQADGNLVLYANESAVWASNCSAECIDRGEPGLATMQEDGNFVVQDSSGVPVWDTSTSGNPDASLAIQDDGNLVVYSANGQVLWHR